MPKQTPRQKFKSSNEDVTTPLTNNDQDKPIPSRSRQKFKERNVGSRHDDEGVDSYLLQDLSRELRDDGSSARSPTSAVEQSLLEGHVEDDSFLEAELNSWSQTLDSDSGSSVWDAAFNFTNSIVGAGIIGLPYAFLKGGFIMSAILLVFLAWLVDYTVGLLVVDGKLSGQTTYQGLIWYCFGQKGYLAVSFFQFIFAYGAMCAYTIILGDTLPLVLSHFIPKDAFLHDILSSRGWMITLCTFLVSLPLSMYRDISALSKTSAMSLAMILFIVSSVVYAGITLPINLKGDVSQSLSFSKWGIFQSIGVMSFAFVCHHNTFLIYSSLKRPTMDRFAIVTHVSTGVSLLLCIVLATAGYVTFVEKTQANILLNFPENHFLMNMARLFFGINMFLTYPLEAFVCREVVFNYLYSDPSRGGIDSIPMTISSKAHVSFTFLLVFSTWVIAMSTCDLGLVLELTGGFSATVLAYILPCLCYLELSSGPVFSVQKMVCMGILCFGVVIMTLSSYFALLTPSSSKHC